VAGRVFVVGSTNVDRTVQVPRLPRPGETALGDALAVSPGGKGANAAAAAARAGATVVFVSAVGADADGEGAIATLRAEGVGVDAVAVRDDAPTGAALIVTDAEGANFIAVAAGANARVDPEQVGRSLAELAATDVVLVSAEIPDAAIEAALRAGTLSGAATVLDPAPARPSLLDAARIGAILTPNEAEALELSGCTDVEEAARRLAALTGRAVVVTLGAAGCLVADGNAVTRLAAAPAQTIVDTVGAGDAFAGGLAAALAGGDSLEAAVGAALRAAAGSLEYAGARPPVAAAQTVYNLRNVTATVPEPVARLLQAANDNNTDAFLAGFTTEGVVDDWGREFAGADAIRSWSNDEFIGKRVSLEVRDVQQDGAMTVVTAQVGGDGFNGPSHFSCEVEGDRVARMTIRA
jgi:ribokinase